MWSLLTPVVSYTAMIRMSGAISKSTDVMKAMQGLVKVPEIQGAMMDLSREMQKVNTKYCEHTLTHHVMT